MISTEKLETLLAQGQDNALVRFSLGSAYFKAAQPERAVEHLKHAVQHDPDYSAAWKLLGQALTQAGSLAEAVKTYTHGITIAERRGDKQAAREMGVFRRRLEKQLQANEPPSPPESR